MDWALPCEPKGCRFNAQSGHMAWVAGQVPGRGRTRGNQLMFLFLFFSFPSPLSENKWVKSLKWQLIDNDTGITKGAVHIWHHLCKSGIALIVKHSFLHPTLLHSTGFYYYIYFRIYLNLSYKIMSSLQARIFVLFIYICQYIVQCQGYNKCSVNVWRTKQAMMSLWFLRVES